MDALLKKKIKTIVKDYITFFPEEYTLVVEQIRQRRDNAVDEFASSQLIHDHKDSAIERASYEIPETLLKMFTHVLTDQELATFRGSKGLEAKKAARWFATTFKEFSLARTI